MRRYITGRSFSAWQILRNAAKRRREVEGEPLDGLNPAAVYSTRRLTSAYTGPVLRVRRSSDNAEADFGFTIAGDLDVAGLLAHTGAGSGFVTTWYDQSGNGRNATQSAALNQPRIVNTGVLETDLGKPILRQTASMFLNVPYASPASPASWSILYYANYVSGGGRILSGNPNFIFGWHGGAKTRYYGGAAFALTQGNAGAGRNTHSVTVENNIIQAITRNGITQLPLLTTAAGAFTSLNTNGRMSSLPEGTENLFGELLIFSDTLSAIDREALEANQIDHYNIE